MGKRLFFGVWLMFSSMGTFAQDFEEIYSSFRQQAEEEYSNFRRQCNEEYAEFMEQTWRQFYGLLPKVPPIKDKPVPPMPYEEGEGSIKEKQLPYVDIVPIAPPAPQPKPVEPIKEQPQPVEERFAFRFYGTEGWVRLEDGMRFSLNGTSENHVAARRSIIPYI